MAWSGHWNRSRPAREASGSTVEFLSPAGFWSVAMPTYASLRLAIPRYSEIVRRIEACKPDSIHIATEGPIGLMVRAYCVKRRLNFTTSYTTRFPEYISARIAIPESWSYAALRWFHSAASVTMVSTPSLAAELAQRGFKNLGMWTRGVNTDVFTPARARSRSTSPARSSFRSAASRSKRISRLSCRWICRAPRS